MLNITGKFLMRQLQILQYQKAE